MPSVPAGPPATGKRIAGSITSGYLDGNLATCYKQALATVLHLTIRTIPVPYLINARSPTTVGCVVTRGKGYM